LLRGIRRWDLVALVINAIIGAGIFGLPSSVFKLVGVYSLLAFLTCAIIVMLIILCFAEVGSRFRETGGPYLYARESMGPVVGFEVGWLMWLARLTAFAANCNLLVTYVGFFSPPAASGWPRAAIITGVVGALTVVNLLGIRNAARATNIFTIAKLAPLVLFIAVGIFFIVPGNFSVQQAAPELGLNAGRFPSAVLLLVYGFTGFEAAVVLAGEMRDPQRDLPMALLTAIGVVTAVYLLVQVVCIGTLPQLAGSERPLADASGRFLGAAGAAIISAGAAVSIVGNLNGTIMGASRLAFAMAERHELPGVLARTHPRFRTPWCAILVTSGIVLALTLSGTFIYALTISTLARLGSYAATCIALLLFRRLESGARPAAFRVPGGAMVALVTLALVVWLFTNSTWREARDTLVAGALGLLVYFTYKMWRARPCF
jgi:amino acid transporter